MANFYRGVEYTSQNITTPTSNSFRKFRNKGEYIYRGVTYDNAQVQLNQRQREGIYRGQKWSD